MKLSKRDKLNLILTVLMLLAIVGMYFINNNWAKMALQDKPKETVTEVEQTVKFKPYDVPLSAELQEYTYNLCQEKNVPYDLVLAVMERESQYNPKAISNGDYGLMQINRINHKELKEKLGITDFLDPKQNIKAGVYMLSNLLERYGDEHKALSCYNLGERGARNVLSSRYSRGVREIRQRIEVS